MHADYEGVRLPLGALGPPVSSIRPMLDWTNDSMLGYRVSNTLQLFTETLILNPQLGVFGTQPLSLL
jgi:hypothetical protein